MKPWHIGLLVWTVLLFAMGLGVLEEALMVGAALLALAFGVALWSQQPEECVLGVDGIRTPRDFFPWESIAKIELVENQLVIHGHDGYRGFVTPRLPGQLHQEALERLEELRRGKLRARPVELGSYRERRAYPPPVLVRIVLDPTVEEDRRIAAFRDLDGEHREEALAGLADEHFRKQLEALD